MSKDKQQAAKTKWLDKPFSVTVDPDDPPVSAGKLRVKYERGITKNFEESCEAYGDAGSSERFWLSDHDDQYEPLEVCVFRSKEGVFEAVQLDCCPGVVLERDLLDLFIRFLTECLEDGPGTEDQPNG